MRLFKIWGNDLLRQRNKIQDLQLTWLEDKVMDGRIGLITEFDFTQQIQYVKFIDIFFDGQGLFVLCVEHVKNVKAGYAYEVVIIC